MIDTYLNNNKIIKLLIFNVFFTTLLLINYYNILDL